MMTPSRPLLPSKRSQILIGGNIVKNGADTADGKAENKAFDVEPRPLNEIE